MSEGPAAPGAGKPLPAWRIALAVGVGLGLLVATLFVPAGRLDWPAAWIYLGLFVATLLANFASLRRRNPELIDRRMRLGEGTKRWDVVWSIAFTPLFLAIYAVAGLDAGRNAAAATPGWTWLLGLALFLSGTALSSWAMGENPFFERTVRIQKERGHRVIDTGPYRIVRHPGYLGFCGWILSAPLLLGSWWAFVPALLSIAALLVRTALEDRTLHAELSGYTDYARRVRCRLLPGLW